VAKAPHYRHLRRSAIIISARLSKVIKLAPKSRGDKTLLGKRRQPLNFYELFDRKRQRAACHHRHLWREKGQPHQPADNFVAILLAGRSGLDARQLAPPSTVAATSTPNHPPAIHAGPGPGGQQARHPRAVTQPIGACAEGMPKSSSTRVRSQTVSTKLKAASGLLQIRSLSWIYRSFNL